MTVFSLGDMVVYNRRKRKAWFAEQKELAERSLQEAKQAAAAGSATTDQILLINREVAAQEAGKEKKESSAWTKTKGIFSTEGLKKEETEGKAEGQVESAGPLSAESSARAPASPTSSSIAGSSVLQAVEQKRRTGERELEGKGITGGPLDQLAKQGPSSSSSEKKNWTSWFNVR